MGPEAAIRARSHANRIHLKFAAAAAPIRETRGGARELGHQASAGQWLKCERRKSCKQADGRTSGQSKQTGGRSYLTAAPATADPWSPRADFTFQFARRRLAHPNARAADVSICPSLLAPIGERAARAYKTAEAHDGIRLPLIELSASSAGARGPSMDMTTRLPRPRIGYTDASL